MALHNTIPPDPDPFEYTFPCLLAQQPIGEVYSGVIPYNILYDICEFDVRRVIYEERDVERYLGIQRPLSTKRVAELNSYVNYADATFPSGIIIALEERCVSFDKNSQKMTIRNILDPQDPVPKRRIARVIDGQHRVAGLRDFQPTTENPKFDCLVTVLVGLDIADQGHIFATVNIAQTKVNRSLAIDLYALEQSRSPLKTCHSVVVALDRDPRGPFYKRIKRLGVTTAGRTGETLSQATVVKGLIGYISADPDGDRDALLRGRHLFKAVERNERELIFRNWFIDNADGNIAVVVSNYFDAVRSKWTAAWENPEPGQILCRTTGYLALSRLLGDIYVEIGGIPSKDQFLDRIKIASLAEADINSQKFLPGSSGEGLLYRTLREQILGR